MSTLKSKSFGDEIQKRHKVLINGFVRRIEQQFFTNHPIYSHIPDIVCSLCFEYYHLGKDRFDPELHGDKVELIDDTKLRMKERHAVTAYLCNIVNTNRHEWRFRAGNKSKYGLVYIGIWNMKIAPNKSKLNQVNYPSGPSSKNFDKQSWGLYATRGKLRGDPNRYGKKYCQECNDGDIIDMRLDLDKNELSYCVNDKDYGKAFDVDPGKWRAFVCLQYADDELELIHYKQY